MNDAKPKSNLSLYEKTKVVAEGKQIFDKVQMDSAHIHLRLNCQDAKVDEALKKHKDLSSVIDGVVSSVDALQKKVGVVEDSTKKYSDTFVTPENLETYDANLRVALDEDFEAVRCDVMELKAQIQVLYNKFEDFQRNGVDLSDLPVEPVVVPAPVEKEPVHEAVREVVREVVREADPEMKVVEKPRSFAASRGTLYKTTINTGSK